MALPAVKHRMTAAEYLDAERAAVDRHEFHDSEMLAMAGSTFARSTPVTHLVRSGRAD